VTVVENGFMTTTIRVRDGDNAGRSGIVAVEFLRKE
jgi:hypothetical protein